MPINVPLNLFPAAVTTITVLSARAVTSLKNFRCATDNQSTPILPKEIALQLFRILRKKSLDLDSSESALIGESAGPLLSILLQ
jgi:hypothetical protein